MEIISTVIYFNNKSFIGSITDYINSHEISSSIFATDDLNRAIEYLKKDLKAILICTEDTNVDVDNRIVYLVENEKDSGIYLYQPCNMLIKDIEKINHNLKEDVKVASFLVASSFDNDFKLVSQVARSFTANGLRPIIIDTNPCRSIRHDCWDLKTKRIIDGNFDKGDIEFADGYYYIKPYSLYEDYYNSSINMDEYLKKLKKLEFVDAILYINHMQKKSDIDIATDYSAKRLALFYSSGKVDEKLLEDIKKAKYETLICVSADSSGKPDGYDFIIRKGIEEKYDFVESDVIKSIREAMR